MQTITSRLWRAFIALGLKSQWESSNFFFNYCPCWWPGTSAQNTVIFHWELWRGFGWLLLRGLGQGKGQWPICVSRNLGISLATFGQRENICPMNFCVFEEGVIVRDRRWRFPRQFTLKNASRVSAQWGDKGQPQIEYEEKKAHSGLMWRQQRPAWPRGWRRSQFKPGKQAGKLERKEVS